MASDPTLEDATAGENPVSPLGGTRAEAIQRLQVGLFGLAAMLLLISLASIILDRLKETESTVVQDTAVTDNAQAAPTNKDPLVDAGVLPELPAQPAQETEPEGDDGAVAQQP